MRRVANLAAYLEFHLISFHLLCFPWHLLCFPRVVSTNLSGSDSLRGTLAWRDPLQMQAAIVPYTYVVASAAAILGFEIFCCVSSRSIWWVCLFVCSPPPCRFDCRVRFRVGLRDVTVERSIANTNNGGCNRAVRRVANIVFFVYRYV